MIKFTIDYKVNLSPWNHICERIDIQDDHDDDFKYTSFEKFKSIIGKERFPLLYKWDTESSVEYMLETQEQYNDLLKNIDENKYENIKCRSYDTFYKVRQYGQFVIRCVLLFTFLLYLIFVGPMSAFFCTIILGYILTRMGLLILSNPKPKEYSKELLELRSYGYMDNNQLIPLLKKYDGDIIKVIIDLK